MGRSMCSLKAKAAQLQKHGLNYKSEPVKRVKSTKPTINFMITSALKCLEQSKGTKEQIITQIETIFSDYLKNDSQKR